VFTLLFQHYCLLHEKNVVYKCGCLIFEKEAKTLVYTAHQRMMSACEGGAQVSALCKRSWSHQKPQQCINTMNIEDIHFPIDGLAAMQEPAFLKAVCNHLGVRVVSVSSNGSCFFDSIYALLPTVGKGTMAANTLRPFVVKFLTECNDGRHGDLGARVKTDMEAALHTKVVSSAPTLKQHNKKPNDMADYLNAVSKRSVWVEGFHWLRAIAALFNVRVDVCIFGFIYALSFGSANDPVSRLWKSDVATHFEPMIPVRCKCTPSHTVRTR
jgi:hypothetical protein